MEYEACFAIWRDRAGPNIEASFVLQSNFKCPNPTPTPWERGRLARAGRNAPEYAGETPAPQCARGYARAPRARRPHHNEDRSRSPGGTIAEHRVYPIPPLTSATITLVPEEPLDLMPVGSPCYDVEFEVIGMNPMNSFSVRGSVLVKVEMHTRSVKLEYS